LHGERNKRSHVDPSKLQLPTSQACHACVSSPIQANDTVTLCLIEYKYNAIYTHAWVCKLKNTTVYVSQLIITLTLIIYAIVQFFIILCTIPSGAFPPAAHALDQPLDLQMRLQVRIYRPVNAYVILCLYEL